MNRACRRFKRVTSRLYYRMLDALGDVHIEPGSADYMLLDRVVVDAVNRIEDQDLFLRGLVRWLGYPLGRRAVPPGPAPARQHQILAAPHGRARGHRHRGA